jgi:GNAT superfamily N-acetyltransferase
VVTSKRPQKRAVRRRLSAADAPSGSPLSVDDKALVFREVDAGRWGDFERLFEGRGGPKYCWCMVFRASTQEAKHTDPVSRKAAMQRRVHDGVPVGLLGYLDGEPVAWCSVAPRSTFRNLGGVDRPEDAQGAVWSITCFFVHRSVRGRGITRQLLEAAVAHARKKGATVVEGYPVEPDSPSYRFMGFIETFEKAGFEQVGRAGTRRHVMRRLLTRNWTMKPKAR